MVSTHPNRVRASGRLQANPEEPKAGWLQAS